MASHEIFVANDDLRAAERAVAAGRDPEPSGKDGDATTLAARAPLRAKLRALMDPILAKRITPFIEQRYPNACGRGLNRKCTPCYSLVRSYKSDARVSHQPHHDAHAVVTVVVSLADYVTDYSGGLYVATARRVPNRRVVGLKRGDAVIHQSDLLHGVQLGNVPGERWSWILWYRDSTTCVDHGHEWFADCADAGDPICIQLHSTKLHLVPGLSQDRIAAEVVKYNTAAAKAGHGEAAVKMARAYLHRLQSGLPFDPAAAARYFRGAVSTSGEPDAHYGLAQMLLDRMIEPADQAGGETAMLSEVVGNLEAAAVGGHTYAMFNLGLAHLYGYGVPVRSPERAAQWFAAAGLPEGYYAAAMYAQAVGNFTSADKLEARALRLGFGSAWRKTARDATGSGGAGGVDLNCNWPQTGAGYRPPTW